MLKRCYSGNSLVDEVVGNHVVVSMRRRGRWALLGARVKGALSQAYVVRPYKWFQKKKQFAVRSSLA